MPWPKLAKTDIMLRQCQVRMTSVIHRQVENSCRNLGKEGAPAAEPNGLSQVHVVVSPTPEVSCETTARDGFARAQSCDGLRRSRDDKLRWLEHLAV